MYLFSFYSFQLFRFPTLLYCSGFTTGFSLCCVYYYYYYFILHTLASVINNKFARELFQYLHLNYAPGRDRKHPVHTRTPV